jgi:hypothetical protein
VAAGEAAVSGFVDVTETSEAGAVLAGTADGPLLAYTGDEASFEREYGPSWELLDAADARRR